MPRPNVPSRPRAISHLWPRVAVLALVGVAVAGCSNSARFDSNPFATNRQAVAAAGRHRLDRVSVAPSRTASYAQPLPAPSRPATVAAAGGTAYGAQGLGAYRPGASDITGSVPAHHAPPPAPAGHWTWDGGSPVTVSRGETVEIIARKYGVPASAILRDQRHPRRAAIRPGQRLVIPRYVSASAAHGAAAPAPQAAPARSAENVHIVEPGESLIGIARKHGVSLTALARANKIQPYAKINIGDRLTVPGGRRLPRAMRRRHRRWRSRARSRSRKSPACRRRMRASPSPSTSRPKA